MVVQDLQVLPNEAHHDLLPHDLLFFHVLSRLPAKSLRRFACVSKLWYSTIQDTWFIDIHHNRAKLNPSIRAMFQVPYNKFRLLHLSVESEDDQLNKPLILQTDGHNHSDCKPNRNIFVDPRRELHRTIGSCNGLLCISRDRDNILIVNLCLHELISIPKPKDPDDIIKTAYFSHSWGFGFDPLKNEYKIVVVYGCHSRRCCMVYTLGSNLWRDVTDTCHPPDSQIFSWTALFCSGALFWSAVYDQQLNNVENIVLFDIHTEEFLVIKAPQVARVDKNFNYFADIGMVEVGGRPCLIYLNWSSMNVGVIEFHLYSLKNHKKNMQHVPYSSQYWIKESIIRVHDPPDFHNYAFSLIEDSNQILVVWATEDGQVVVYNPIDKRQHTMPELSVRDSSDPCLNEIATVMVRAEMTRGSLSGTVTVRGYIFPLARLMTVPNYYFLPRPMTVPYLHCAHSQPN